MHSSLIDRVDSWFSDPDEYPLSQQNQRAWVFMAIVDQLGLGLHNAADLKRIHNFFTYSLLGWNPVTAWVDIHISKTSQGTRLWSPEFVALIKQLLNFKRPVTTAERYSILQNFSRYAAHFSSVEDTQIREEELVLTVLLFWFLDRHEETCLTLDIVAVRACLDLYHRSKEHQIMSLDLEATKNHPMNYAHRLNTQLNRLLVRDIGFEELCREMSYLAWFSCLVRANRMVTALGAVQDTYGSSLRATFEHHVNEMYKYLENFPLIAIDETDGATDRLLDVSGIRTKHK